MSEEDVDLARQASEMFNRRDLHGFLGLMAMDVTFQPQLGASSHGHDGMRRLWDALIEGSDLGVEVVEIRDLGADLVLAAVREQAATRRVACALTKRFGCPAAGWRESASGGASS